jgi:hypothetical protein
MQKDVHTSSIFFLLLLVNETDCNCTGQHFDQPAWQAAAAVGSTVAVAVQCHSTSATSQLQPSVRHDVSCQQASPQAACKGQEINIGYQSAASCAVSYVVVEEAAACHSTTTAHSNPVALQ